MNTPAYAFATAFLDRSPPSTDGDDWTAVDWFANVIRIRFGADIGEKTWAAALGRAGIELRLSGDRIEARMSEHNVLDWLDHRATPAEQANMRR